MIVWQEAIMADITLKQVIGDVEYLTGASILWVYRLSGKHDQSIKRKCNGAILTELSMQE